MVIIASNESLSIKRKIIQQVFGQSRPKRELSNSTKQMCVRIQMYQMFSDGLSA